MQRSSAVLLVAGATGLLVTLGVLVRAVHNDSSDAKSTAVDRETTTSTGPGATTHTRDQPGRPTWRPAGPAHGEDSAAETAPVVDDHPPPGPPSDPQNLQLGGTQMRYQTQAVRPAVEKCVADKGGNATGTAMVTYIVSKKGDKYIIEDTGVDEDRTTVSGNTELLDCLRDTAKGMTFVGLPKDAQSIVVSRSVTLDGGHLVDYKHVGFSYLQ